MGFHEDRRNANRRSTAGHDGGKLTLAARRAALAAGLGHGMGRVHHHRISGLGHLRQAAHVGDQRVVAEGRAAFGQQDVAVPGAFDLIDDVLHLPRGEELPLLHVHRLSGLPGGEQQVGLAAEEGGDLQHVDHVTDLCALRFIMHIRQHRHVIGTRHGSQDLQPLFDAQTALAREGGAVGLVIAALEDELRAGGVTCLFQHPRHHLRVVFALQLAGASDHGEGTIIADGQIANAQLGHEVTCSLRMDAVRDNIR